MNKPRPGILWASLLGIAFFMVFIQATAPSLDSDGIHYGAAAKEMARTGRVLLPYDPTLAAPYYWHFPLSVLPTAILLRLFGVSPFVAKLYSMTMTLVAVAALFILGQILSGPWAGWCVVVAMLAREQWLVRSGDLSHIDQAFFTLNSLIGLVFFTGHVLEWWLSRSLLGPL